MKDNLKIKNCAHFEGKNCDTILIKLLTHKISITFDCLTLILLFMRINSKF
jgi:hypothetical protein